MPNTTQTQHPKTRVVSAQDLPVACPMPDMALWSEHPRVFLSFEKTGEATCPYCSTHYVLHGTAGAH
jgi:uncharacterized Zn-finger protein